MTEKDIKHKLREAPDEGFRALFDEYWSYAYTIIYNVLRDSASRNDVEDCTAEVLSDVMMKYDTLRDTSLKAYIGTSAKRRAIDFKRSINIHSSLNIPLDPETEFSLPSADDVEADTERVQISAILLDKIEELGEPDSSIIIQKYFYDRNSTETARILGMNPITVRSRLRRALKKLKTALTDLDITL